MTPEFWGFRKQLIWAAIIAQKSKCHEFIHVTWSMYRCDMIKEMQWCNRWGQSAHCPSETSDREISADLPGKMRQGKKGKGVKIEKRRKIEMEGGKVTKWGEDFRLFKPLKFVLGLRKWKFSTGKKHFKPGKKSGKIILPHVTPLRKWVRCRNYWFWVIGWKR